MEHAGVDFRSEVVPALVLAHAEDAGFLWMQRAARCASNLETPAERLRFDMRLDAHLDGLRTCAARAFDLCLDEVEAFGTPRAVFVTACLAFSDEGPRRFERLFAAMPWTPEPLRALVAASAFSSRAETRSRLGTWAASDQPSLCYLGLAGLCVSRLAPLTLLESLLHSEYIEIRARAAAGVAEHGAVSLAPALTGLLGDADESVRFEAARALGRFRDRSPDLVSVLLAECHSQSVKREEAARALARLIPREAQAWFAQFAADDSTRRLAIAAAEASGEGSLLRELVEMTADPTLARRAAEALHSALDLDLTRLDLEAAEPPVLPDGPNDDPGDPRVALDVDHALPWPAPERVGQYVASLSLRDGTRYLAGREVGRLQGLSAREEAATLLDLVSHGRARQRRLAAEELAVRVSERPLIETRAPAFPRATLPGHAAWLADAVP